MKKLATLLLALVASVVSIAQLTYESRTEFELKNGYAGEQIITFEEKGFMLRSKNVEKIEGEEEWKFEFYSTDIKELSSESFMIDKSYYLDETSKVNDYLHNFFRTKKGEYVMYSIQAKTMESQKVSGEFPKKTYVREMVILKDHAHFFTDFKGKELYLYSVNWRTGSQKKLPIQVPGFKTKKLKMLRMQVFEETDELLIYIRAKTGMKTNEIFVFRYDSEGNYLGKFQLTEDVERNFTSISASPIGNERYIFTGTYSTKGNTVSQGLYFCESESGNVNFVEYYNFTDLENFFTYISERKQERIEKKKERKKAKGKELSYNYLIADHPIILLDEGYLFIGEAYYPTYRTEYYTTYSNGVPVTRTRRVFDGYQYTHAVVARYDKQGKMVWDQIFELYPSYKPFHVKRFISIAEGDQTALNLVFANNKRLVSKSISHEGEVLSERESEEIETGYEGDKTKSSFSNISYWYDNYFIAYGKQKIKNKDKDEKKRKVYFISKIKFE